ncbi:MAG: PAC2 family protein [Candidatus Nanoarchaeia archaeon]|nr:PAC2 family protein [Candidatus Nanoarchaeia archaeon]
MKFNILKKPKNSTLITGFPGFGLVGNIVIESLIENMKFEVIGTVDSPELPATVAIHKGEVLPPIRLLHNKEKNILLLHSLINVKGYEWVIADEISKLVKTLGIKEILSIEGVTGPTTETLYCFNNKKFEKLGAIPITESVVLGVTAALLLKLKTLSCIFAPTQTDLPDSRAAAKVIEFLDKLFGLKIDPKKLLLQAELSEAKLKNLMKASEKAEVESKRKQLSYLG